jgi:hypothetical protein
MAENLQMRWTIEDCAEEVGEGSPLLFAVDHHPQGEAALDALSDLVDAQAVRISAWIDGDDVHAHVLPLVPGLEALAESGGGLRRVPRSLWMRPEG